jgi:hypothetical protein
MRKAEKVGVGDLLSRVRSGVGIGVGFGNGLLSLSGLEEEQRIKRVTRKDEDK